MKKLSAICLSLIVAFILTGCARFGSPPPSTDPAKAAQACAIGCATKETAKAALVVTQAARQDFTTWAAQRYVSGQMADAQAKHISELDKQFAAYWSAAANAYLIFDSGGSSDFNRWLGEIRKLINEIEILKGQ